MDYPVERLGGRAAHRAGVREEGLSVDEFTRTARIIRELRPLVFKGKIGYEFCVCENCKQRVDAHDMYCRGCGRALVKGADE